MNRKQKTEWLRLILVTRLRNYCQSQYTRWPDHSFLRMLEDSVMGLVAKERKKPPAPVWKAFLLLNRRMPSLRLVVRVNNLIKRACDRLQEVGESGLVKLARQEEQGSEDAQRLLRDVESLRKDLSVAKGIEWQQHERTLAQFSRTRSVELACNQTAPIGVRCYSRALELLLVDKLLHEPLRKNSWPLIEWVARIDHPEAKSLLAFDAMAAWVIEQDGNSQEKKALRKRELGRERTKRHRGWKRSKLVYPGYWLRFRGAADFRASYGRKHSMPETCIGLEDSDCRNDLEAVLDKLSCGRKLADEPEGFYYHPTRHVARCYDCQATEWISQGFDVVNGFPYGDWDATTEERLAEQERDALQSQKQDLLRLREKHHLLQTDKRRGWLQEADAEIERIDARLRQLAKQQ